MGTITLVFATDASPVVDQMMKNLKEILQRSMFIQDPFVFSQKKGEGEGELYLNVISMKPPFPQWVVFVLSCLCGAIGIMTGGLVIDTILSVLGLLFVVGAWILSPSYLLFKVRRALKRKGYIGPIKNIKLEDSVVLLYGTV